MRAACVLAFCAGCSQVFGLDPPEKLDAFQPPLCLQDRFNDTRIDPVLWNVSADNSTIEEAGGQLVFTLPAENVKNVVGTASVIDISTATVQVEVVEATEQSLDAVTRFFVGSDTQHFLELRSSNNLLVAHTMAAGIDDEVMKAWDSNAFRFWAIAYDAATETATYATSPNGTAWNPVRTIQVALASTALIELGADNTLMTGTPPGKARFDNFVVLTPTCVP